MQTTKVDRVRGMNDVLPEGREINKQIEQHLFKCFESFGYRPIEVPIVEHTDLYLRKSGEDIITRLYDFVYQNRRLCLRPEMTASIIRAYADNLEGASSLPVRLYYVGPVFRYERPQRARYRQFTQIGIESIGATGAMSDAEAIAVACKGLDSLGLSDRRVVIGHVGVLDRFLDNLSVDSRLRSFLLGSLEVLRQEGGRQRVEGRLSEIYPQFGLRSNAENNSSPATEEAGVGNGETGKLIDIFQAMDRTDAKTAILELLDNLKIELSGNRSSEEIAERLLVKIERQDRTSRLSKALEFMTELAQLKGEPYRVLEEGEKLLSVYGIDPTPMQELRDLAETLKFYDLDWSTIDFDLGLSRGLLYYTGTVFEIHHGALGEERQLCGGGRYDDLAVTLGSKEKTPATGFSYGLERIRLALESEGKQLASGSPSVDVLAIAVSADDRGYAIGVAEKLRKQGVRVELDVRGRSVSSNFQYANKQGIPFAIVVGAEEKLASSVVLKNLTTREQEALQVSDAADRIIKFIENHE